MPEHSYTSFRVTVSMHVRGIMQAPVHGAGVALLGQRPPGAQLQPAASHLVQRIIITDALQAGRRAVQAQRQALHAQQWTASWHLLLAGVAQ